MSSLERELLALLKSKEFTVSASSNSSLVGPTAHKGFLPLPSVCGAALACAYLGPLSVDFTGVGIWKTAGYLC